jgi:hypothetical protein
MRRFLSGLCAAGAAAGVAIADGHPKRPLVAPFYCPPAVPQTLTCPPATVTPVTPGAPPVVLPDPTTGAPVTPDLTGTTPVPGGLPGSAGAAATAAAAADQFAAGTARGVGAYASFNENLMGDLIGARSLRIGYKANLSATFGLAGAAATASGGPAVRVDPNARGGTLLFTDTAGRQFSSAAAFSNSNLQFVQPTVGGTAAFDAAFARSALQTLLSNGELTPAQIQSFQQLSAADRAQLLANRGAINAQLARATRGLTVPNVTVTSVGGAVGGNAITYNAVLESTTVLALPGASSVVGRVKMSEDNSPLPRDRVIFTYDSFGDVPFTPNGVDVNRFQFGVEKTFRDGLWSVEFRLPFAGTLASTYVQGFETTDVELGNVRFALKRLWTRNDRLNFAGGLGVTLPTARDQAVLSQFGGELFRFQNESVQVEPFVAALFTPNERLFAQAWGAVNFDASGGRLTWDPNVFGGSGSARIWDLPILAIDGQIGYWVVKNRSGVVRGAAPFLELHYNQVLGQNVLIDEVSDRANSQGLTVTGIGNQEFNITAGVLCQLGDNLNLTLGASAPLLRQPDRTFDWQFGLRMNYFFGRTARQRAVINQVSGF